MIKIVRIVTSNYCISTHLLNTIKRVPVNYKVYIIGDKVEDYSYLNNDVTFINLPIKRNFNFIYDLYCLVKLFIILSNIRPHITHSLMAKGGLLSSIASLLAGVKFRIHTFTGQVWAKKRGLKKFFLIIIDKIICKLNSDCLTDSQSQSEYLFKHGVKKFKKPLKFILNGSISGVDLKRFVEIDNNIKDSLRLKYKINKNDFVITYIARKSVDKGCMDMLTIYKNLIQSGNKLKLFFIGPDESNDEIQKFYSKNLSLKKTIIDLGFVHNHQDYLSISNILCLPSYREGFGSIVIDAAAAEVPSIGYKIPGLVDSIVENETGFLVQPGDINDFVNKICELKLNNKSLEYFKSNAFKYAKTSYDADLFNSELYKYYLDNIKFN